MKTTREIYTDRINATPLTEDAIKSAFREMITDQTADWNEAGEGSRFNGSPEELTRINLGYMLGYFGETTRRAWYAALPGVSHPIFGSSFGRGKDPTPEEAFAIGFEQAKGEQR